MTTITSAADINTTTETEVSIDVEQRDITLNLAGNLTATGVTLQALYSYLKKAWRIQTFSIGTASSSGTTVTLANTTNVLPGMAVAVTAGTGAVTATATVVSVDSGTTFTLSETPSPALSGATLEFTNHLIEYPFPLVAITPEQFEFAYDWTLNNDASRKLIRTAGWKELSTDGTIQKEFVGIISLGNIDGEQDGSGGGDQDIPYYAFRTSGTIPYDTKIDFTYAGEINEAIQTYDDNGGSPIDNRSKEIALFIREEGKTFGKSDTVAIGIATGTQVSAQAFRFPLSEGNDLNYIVTDAQIQAADGSGEFYDLTAGQGPQIRYFATDQDSTVFLPANGKHNLTAQQDFGVLIDATAGDGTTTNASGYLALQQLYSWPKYRLRQAVDIDDEGGSDASTQIGNTSDELLQFVGPQLQTKLVQNGDGATTPSGVAIEDFASTDVGNLAFAFTGYTTGALATFPLIASGTISFNANLAEDTDATYTMYYEYTREYDVPDLTIGNVSQSAGNPGTATFSSAGNAIPTCTVGDYIDVSGFPTAGNNGVWEVTDVTSQPASIDVTRLDDLTINAEAVSTAAADDDNFRFNPVNSPDALIVEDSSGAQISGAVPQQTGGSSVTFDYGYTNDTSPDSANTGENRESNEVVNVSIRASGTTKAQWVETLGTIGISSGVAGNANNFSIVAPLERNYAA